MHGWIRDPWGRSGPDTRSSTRTAIKFSEFLKHWHWALNNAAFRNRLEKLGPPDKTSRFQDYERSGLEFTVERGTNQFTIRLAKS